MDTRGRSRDTSTDQSEEVRKFVQNLECLSVKLSLIIILVLFVFRCNLLFCLYVLGVAVTRPVSVTLENSVGRGLAVSSCCTLCTLWQMKKLSSLHEGVQWLTDEET